MTLENPADVPEDPNDPNNPGNPDESDGLVDVYYDADGNVIQYPERVSAAERDRRIALRLSKANADFDPNYGKPAEGAPKPAGGGTPPYNPGYKFAPVPKFGGLPDFVGPDWKAPSFEDAMNDPGYRFAADEGRRAREASAASRGDLRSGGTLRSLERYGQNIGAQQYQSVYNRRFGEHDLDYRQQFGEYGQKYRQELDQYSPLLAEWSLLSNAEIGGKNIANQNQWQNYWGNNLTAAQLLALLGGL